MRAVGVGGITEEEDDCLDDAAASGTLAPRRYLFHSSTLRASVPMPTGAAACPRLAPPDSPPPPLPSSSNDSLCLVIGIVSPTPHPLRVAALLLNNGLFLPKSKSKVKKMSDVRNSNNNDGTTCTRNAAGWGGKSSG